MRAEGIPDTGVEVVVRRTGSAGREDLLLHRVTAPLHPTLVGLLEKQHGIAGEVWPIDLSGRPRLFSVAEQPALMIGFRPMTRADFADVVRWQHEPHVARWWHDEATDLAGAERHYGPALDGEDPTRMWIVEMNGRSVGYVQDYRIGDHPEYAILTAEPEAIGFDYAIGEPAWVGKGFGTRMLWCFLRDVVRPYYPDAPIFFAAPDHRNAASLRVLDKLGFERGLWFDEPQPDGSVDTVVSCKLDVRLVFG